MPASCNDIRSALAECLQNSDCVMVQRNSAADCLRPPLNKELPTRCQQLQKGLAECKRGLVDMRKRFRGNHQVALSAEKEGGTGKGQLYGGKSAYGVVETDGREEDRNPSQE